MQTQGTLKAMLNYVARLQTRVIKREFQESQRIYNEVMAASDTQMGAVSGKGWRIPTYLRPKSGMGPVEPTDRLTCFDPAPPVDDIFVYPK